MKLITTLSGLCSIRVTDEATPANGIIPQNLIAAIQSRYRFALAPTFPGPIVPNTGLIFQYGGLESVSIHNLTLGSNALIVSAQRTELADQVAEDLITFLDSSFNYRMKQGMVRRAHGSNIVVQFQKSFEERIPKLAAIQAIVQKAIEPNRKPAGDLGLARLGFTFEEWHTGPAAAITPDTVETMDFQIERRVQTPYADNWYYSVAPLTTPQHIDLMQQIENAILAD